jgi:two-component system NarL family sensor kinase
VQEALNNVAKHAQAHHAWVEFALEPDQVQVSIRDDGRGFEVTSALKTEGLGLRHLRERVEELRGKFTIESSPGKGTRLTAVLPLIREEEVTCD